MPRYPLPIMDAKQIVHSDPEILGGTPVFVGTRVPVKNLLDYLAAGDSLEKFPITSRQCPGRKLLPPWRWLRIY